MANENYDPYDQAYWGKGKGKKGKKENHNSNIPMMETRVIHPMRMAKEKADSTKENPRRSQPSQRRRSSPPSSRLHHPQTTYAGWTDQDWDQSWTWNEHHPMRHPFHDAYEHHEKEAIHGKLIQSQFVRNKSQPFGKKADGGQRMYQIHGQLACNPAFYSGHRIHEGHHLLSVHPGQVHFCKQRDRQGKLDPASSISHNSSTQYQHQHP